MPWPPAYFFRFTAALYNLHVSLVEFSPSQSWHSEWQICSFWCFL